jgi:hypothetical protein
MSDQIATIFAECIEGIEEGRFTVNDCLNKYPEFRTELAQLLPLAVEARSAPKAIPDPAFQQGARARLMAKLPARRALVGQNEPGPLLGMVALVESLFQRLQSMVPQTASNRWRFAARATLAGSVVGLVGLTILTVLLGLQLGGEGISEAEAISAKAESATVEVVQGLVEVRSPGGKWVPVSKIAPVEAGQRIRTGKLASAKLTFPDGRSISLGPNRDVSFDWPDAKVQLIGPSALVTATVTMTPTTTATPTVTMTPTLTATPTPTVTVTPTTTATPTVTTTPTATMTSGNVDLVTICHKPGTPAEKTMTLPRVAAEGGHMVHGDYTGACLATATPVPPGTEEPTATPPAPPVPPGGNDKVTICHKPGTPAQKTKSVPASALNDHLGHGDTTGACSP